VCHSSKWLFQQGSVFIFYFICGICAPFASALGQEAAAVPDTNQMPRTCNGCSESYKSWSLFLICNPRWILRSGDKGILDLYTAFDAFGRAIGPDNLAVWFTHQPGQTPTIKNTDIERMSKYCAKFGLRPSQTPQVVTVTHYPDDSNVGATVVANLNGSAEDSANALTDLADELLKAGLDQASLDESHWGSTIAGSVSTTMSHASCYLNKVSFSIKTGVFNAEITHAADKGC
jgi:hypothetical protein